LIGQLTFTTIWVTKTSFAHGPGRIDFVRLFALLKAERSRPGRDSGDSPAALTFGKWSSSERLLAMAGIAMLVSIIAPTAVKAQPAGAGLCRTDSDMPPIPSPLNLHAFEKGFRDHGSSDKISGNASSNSIAIFIRAFCHSQDRSLRPSISRNLQPRTNHQTRGQFLKGYFPWVGKVSVLFLAILENSQAFKI